MFPHGVSHDPWSEDEWHSIQGYQRYLLQVQYVDLLLGKLLTRLDQRGRYDETLIIVLSDHGLSFRPGAQRRIAAADNYEEILPVPLFVKRPYQRQGGPSERNAEITDVLPTIADSIGAPVPWEFDGISLLTASNPDRPPRLYHGRDVTLRTLPDPAETKYRVLDRMLQLFGSGSADLYRIGRAKDLLGRRVSELPIAKIAQARVALEAPRISDPVDLDAAMLPVHVSGRLIDPEVGFPEEVAIGVNDVVEAVTMTYVEGRETRFTALVPERALRPGRNRIDFLALERATEGGDDELRIWRVHQQQAGSAHYTLESAKDIEALYDFNGNLIPIDREGLKGHVDLASQDERALKLTGWAADLDANEPVRIAVFVDDRLVFTGRTNQKRSDVVRAHPQVDSWSGFRFEIDRTLLGSDEIEDLRVFAVSARGVATELHYYAEYPWRPQRLPGDASRPISATRSNEEPN
jgi:hypothetical protein